MTENDQPEKTDPAEQAEPADRAAKDPDIRIPYAPAGNSGGNGKKPWKGSRVWAGIGLVALLHLLNLIFPMALAFIGITQLIYVGPALVYFRKDTAMMQGILIGAGITFLINAACFGIVFVTFANH